MRKTISGLYSKARAIYKNNPDLEFKVSEIQDIRAAYPEDIISQMQWAYTLGLVRGSQINKQ